MKKMKQLSLVTMIFTMAISTSVTAQEKEDSKDNEKLSYYEKRAKEDAEYEQSLVMSNEADEKDFWKDQKRYEKDLRKRDKRAYKAYMQRKSDAYAEHKAYCGQHCHHSDQYYHHAHFYYSYSEYHYPSSRATVQTRVRIASPRVGLSIF